MTIFYNLYEKNEDFIFKCFLEIFVYYATPIEQFQ